MELISSFIAIWEAAAERQVSQETANSTVTIHQPTQTPESVAVEALLFNKPTSSVRVKHSHQ